MKTFSRIVALISFVWLAFGSATLTPAAVQRTYTAGSFRITIDGVAYPNVRSCVGGEYVADVVTESTPATGTPKKHVANFHATPLRVEFTPDDLPSLAALMNEVLGNQPGTHTVMLVETDYSGQAKSATEYSGSVVSGLELDAFDGSSRNTVSLTLVFQSAQVRSAPLPAASTSPSPRPKTALASNFRFALDGLPCTRVATVAALSAQRAVETDSVGSQRGAGLTTGKLVFANLVVGVATADLPAWQAWADAFLVQGHHLDSDEKNASLVQLNPDMSTPIFTVNFSHVGLVRLSQAPAATGTVARFEVELYFEGASVPASGASTAATGSTTPEPSSGTPATTNPATTADPAAGATDAGSGSTATPAGNTGTSTGTAGTAAASTKDLTAATLNPARQAALPTTLVPRTADLNPVVPPPLPATATGTPAAARNDPADQGVRDPREFLRIDGLVRKSYSSFDAEGSSEETVTYTAKAGIDDVVSKYESAMKGAGWEEARKDESGSASDFSHYYHLKWTKTVQEADLRFTQTKTGGTEMTIAVYTRRVGILSGLAAAMQGAGKEAAATEGTANDLGARDPADFPRIAHATRKSYSASGTATAPEEAAVYRTKTAIASVEAFFVSQLNQADWEEIDRRENGDPLGGTHDITLRWVRGKRSARIYLKEIEPGITEITLALSTSG